MSRLFLLFLLAEIATIAIVVLIFRMIPDRLVGGAVAGSVFVLLGSWIVGTGLLIRPVRRSFTFYLGGLHLFFVALPMMITRFLNWAQAFSEIRVLGLPGPVFHRLSTFVYLAMIIGTTIDFWRMRRNEKGSR